MNATDEQVNEFIKSLRSIEIFDELREYGKAKAEYEFNENEKYTAMITVEAFYATEFPTGRYGRPQIDVFVSDFCIDGEGYDLSSDQLTRIMTDVYKSLV
jgi:hypothetical protein